MNSKINKVFKNLKKVYGLSVEKNVLLKNLTSFKIGGKTKILVKPASLEHFIKCYHILNDNKIPYYILGNATNVLISDNYFSGAVIKIGSNYSKIKKFDDLLIVQSGALLNKVIAFSCGNNLKGMEEGYGIPGTIGGAVYMNASAYGFEMKNVVNSVLAMIDGKIKEFSNKECEFGYRSSVFQRLKNVIILEVELKLEKIDSNSLDLINIMLNAFSKKKNSQPLNTNNAGSVFKSVDGVPAWKFIDQLKLQNYSCGGARICEKHANFIENYNNAKSEDVVKLINFIKKYIKSILNIDLELEIKIMGEKK